eukprot:1179984-Prorocentrum_minimum.AAC.3
MPTDLSLTPHHGDIPSLKSLTEQFLIQRSIRLHRSDAVQLPRSTRASRVKGTVTPLYPQNCATGGKSPVALGYGTCLCAEGEETLRIALGDDLFETIDKNQQETDSECRKFVSQIQGKLTISLRPFATEWCPEYGLHARNDADMVSSLPVVQGKCWNPRCAKRRTAVSLPVLTMLRIIVYTTSMPCKHHTHAIVLHPVYTGLHPIYTRSAPGLHRATRGLHPVYTGLHPVCTRSTQVYTPSTPGLHLVYTGLHAVYIRSTQVYTRSAPGLHRSTPGLHPVCTWSTQVYTGLHPVYTRSTPGLHPVYTRSTQVYTWSAPGLHPVCTARLIAHTPLSGSDARRQDSLCVLPPRGAQGIRARHGHCIIRMEHLDIIKPPYPSKF